LNSINLTEIFLIALVLLVLVIFSMFFVMLGYGLASLISIGGK